MEGLDESTINRLPSIHNIQKRVGAQKRRAQNIRPIPHNREEIEIPDDLQQTLTNPVEQFLLHDSGADDPLRIIVFASPSDLRRLSECSTWLADGTFDVSAIN